MAPGQRRAVWLLGLCQCVFWGVLYYGFSVWLVPIEADLGLSQAKVAGAFSLGLLAMALVAPRMGRALDRGQSLALSRIGTALAVSGLLVLAGAKTALALYGAWIVLGLAMALLLYESAFAIVIRAVHAPAERLRALAAVTVMGGLASTLFLPLMATITGAAGWRASVYAGAVLVLLSLWVMERHVLPALPGQILPVETAGLPKPSRRSRSFALLVAIFTTGTVASMAVTTLLIPLLILRDVPGTAAATVLATLGVAQLPGRIWLLRGGRQPSSRTLASLPLLLQGVGLSGMAVAPSLMTAALAVAVFGLGSGLQTLARPWLVQQIYGAGGAGYWNGQLARAQGFGRAAGPVVAVAIATWISANAVLWGLAFAMFCLLPAARWLTHAGGQGHLFETPLG